jgi:hypothetical protein
VPDPPGNISICTPSAGSKDLDSRSRTARRIAISIGTWGKYVNDQDFSGLGLCKLTSAPALLTALDQDLDQRISSATLAHKKR